MIFKRREQPPLGERLRQFMYPRKGFWRGVDYLGKRIKRLPDSPHRIALGFACGGFASFTPLFGFHFFVAAALAYLLRANLLASAFGTAVGNPLTFPFIAAASLQVGFWLTGADEELSSNLSFGWLTDNIDLIFWPYAIGGLLPGLACGVLCYGILGPIVAAYQQRRRKVLSAKAEARRRAADREQEAYQMHDAEGDNA
ncbi:MAG: DUF2062 domain-containing protein [Pseudomonadota bacterium]